MRSECSLLVSVITVCWRPSIAGARRRVNTVAIGFASEEVFFTMSAGTYQDDHEHHSEIVSLNVQTQVGDWAYAAPVAAVFSRMSAPTVHQKGRRFERHRGGLLRSRGRRPQRVDDAWWNISQKSGQLGHLCTFGAPPVDEDRHVYVATYFSDREWWQLRGDYLSLEYGHPVGHGSFRALRDHTGRICRVGPRRESGHRLCRLDRHGSS